LPRKIVSFSSISCIDFNKNKSKTLVTIGVCVRNCEETIASVIENIINQDFPHNLMEVIFVDDGSRDNTLKIINAFISKIDFRFKIISNCWRGLGVARQTVVNDANGKYIIWVDGDTFLSRDYVRKQVSFMETRPKVGIVQGRCWNQEKLSQSKNLSLVAFLEWMGFVAVDLRYRGRNHQKLPGTAGSTYRLKALKQVGGFDERIKGAGEDLDAAFRIKKSGWQVYLATGGTFYTRRKETWSDLWKQYYWHGYGCHFVSHKNRDLSRLYDMIPPVAFLAGLFYSFIVYKLTNRKVVFLLPFHFVFKQIAWWFGFIKSHLDSYGHVTKVSNLTKRKSQGKLS
jgi:glycosyltransferase involved in cell wall biosynthesis